MAEELKRGKLCQYDNPKKNNSSLVLVLRRVDNKMVLCVRVFPLLQRFSLPAYIDGEKQYVDYSQFMHIKTEHLKETEKCLQNARIIIDKVYNKSKLFNRAERNYRRKRAKQKREDQRKSEMLKECRQVGKMKIKMGNSVAWQMTHPVQGGRTSSK